MFEFFPDVIIAFFILLVGIIIGLIVRRKNVESRLSKTRFGQPEQSRKRHTITTSNCPLYSRFQSGKRLLCPFLSNEQHQEQETTRIKHELNQE